MLSCTVLRNYVKPSYSIQIQTQAVLLNNAAEDDTRVRKHVLQTEIRKVTK